MKQYQVKVHECNLKEMKNKLSLAKDKKITKLDWDWIKDSNMYIIKYTV